MTTTPDSLTALQSALDALTAALVTGQPDAVLAVETRIATAVRHLQAHVTAGQAARSSVDLVKQAAAMRASLYRCRALGVSADELRAILIPSPAYTAPHRPSSPRAHRTVKERA